MTSLLIAERFNGKAWRPACPIPSDEYLHVQLKLGVFRQGPTREKLSALGVTFKQSMNLMPPDFARAPWDYRLAKEIAAFIVECKHWDVIYICGRRVAQAFDLPNCSYGTVFGLSPLEKDPQEASMWACVVPHPSSNGWWRNYENRITLKEILDGWARRRTAIGSPETVSRESAERTQV
jgi:hypothetical protein